MNTIWRALLSCGNCWEVNNVTEKTNVPEIRFAGFTDPWEQRKFSDLTDRVSIQSGDSDLPQVEYEDIVSGEGTLNKDLHDKEGGKTGIKFYAGDVLYGKLRPYLMNWLYPQFNGIAVGDFWVLRATECDSSFLYRLVQTDSFQRLANVSTGSKMPRADWNLISQSFFAVPADYAEQKAIAKSLAELDSLITLHQRKHDKLVQLKKSMLDKMFPKPGETEPEIRFAGFTDPWEQRKLGELLLFQNGFNGSSESFGSGIPLISVMDVLDDEFITHETVRGKARLNYEEASRYCVEYGDVLFQRSSENQEDAGTSNVYLDQHVPSAFGGFVIRGKKVDEYNPIFIKYLLGSSFIREQITHRAQGAQHINVSQDTLAGVVLLMPSMREQEAVGLVFLHLANLITLHQRKLELLRNTKKSLLERMFV